MPDPTDPLAEIRECEPVAAWVVERLHQLDALHVLGDLAEAGEANAAQLPEAVAQAMSDLALAEAAAAEGIDSVAVADALHRGSLPAGTTACETPQD